ncbi:hypothetical protein HK100_001869, partial [Physocladia obscura]
LCAHAAGIRVFVTGGIGGVHRGGESSLDISADLTELAKTPVAVICAGAKAILDIGRTLEFLETHGVPVVTYKSDFFPAFYTPTSDFKGIARLDSPQECADMIWAQSELGMVNGSVIAVPIPDKDVTIDKDVLDVAILAALAEAEQFGIRGKEITPFLLAKVKDITRGKSLDANIALIKNNAAVGSQIAVCLAKISNPQSLLNKAEVKTYVKVPSSSPKDTENKLKISRQNQSGKKILVIGATNLDITAKFNGKISGSGKSSSGSVRFSLGGVGRNIAEAAFRTLPPASKDRVRFISAIADDAAGRLILSQMSAKGLDSSELHVLPSLPSVSTAFYNSVLDCSGDIVAGVADMSIHSLVGRNDSCRIKNVLTEENPDYIVLDANIDVQVLKECIKYAHQNHIPCLFEPTSVPKASKIFQILDNNITPDILLSVVKYVTPNTLELHEMHAEAVRRGLISIPSANLSILAMALEISSLFSCVLVKLGVDGVLVVCDTKKFKISTDDPTKMYIHNKEQKHSLWLPSKKLNWDGSSIVSVTGAGDSMVGAFLVGIANDMDILKAVEGGLIAAKLSLTVEDAVNENLTWDLAFIQK